MSRCEPTLRQKVDFLRRPDSYPDRTEQVHTVETHMSWVFLAVRFAYKLKKPVRFDYLDFSTLEARYRDCQEEIRLNRRLAPRVYLGVMPLTSGADGKLRLGGEGVIVDWLVKMRRLPSARMLDRMIAEDRVDQAAARRAAAHLARFYVELVPATVCRSEFIGRFAEEARTHGRQLAKPEFGMPVRLVRLATSGQTEFLRTSARLLGDRAGRVVEGHGDLRPEHIYLGDPPAVIDCLEFNRAFRIVDPAEELAFLWMECEVLAAPAVGELFWNSYSQATGDRPPPELLSFYKCRRACLRAKLSLWHLADCRPERREEWRARGLRYLRLAAAHAEPLARGRTGLQPSSSSTIDPPS